MERMPLRATENDSSRMYGNSHIKFVFLGGGGKEPNTDIDPSLCESGLVGLDLSENEVVGLPLPTNARIRKEQHLAMFMTNRILTY